MTFGEMILGSRDLTDLMACMNAESRREGMLIEQRMTEHYGLKPVVSHIVVTPGSGRRMTTGLPLPPIEYGLPPAGWDCMVQRISLPTSIEKDLEIEHWFWANCPPDGRRGACFSPGAYGTTAEKILWVAAPPIHQEHSPKCMTMTEASPSPYFTSDTAWGCTCGLDRHGKLSPAFKPR